VGDLRFKAPIPPASWDDTLDTTSLDVNCYLADSDNDAETEDCLYINVYTPQVYFIDRRVGYYFGITFSFPLKTNR
jgi:carboxylesterase type B